MTPEQVEAREHIRSIRTSRGIDGNDNLFDPNDVNVADLARSLDLTATQLYADSLHFIWEIIQNNDDAPYENLHPQLQIDVTDSIIRIWSNQTGFRRTDVDSICRIGDSSKRTITDTIGSKGIGFKSLFAVADKVEIHSEPYHFKFDTTTPLRKLGMIVPTWIEYSNRLQTSPVCVSPNGTTMLLHLKSTNEARALRNKLHQLNFSFLIFCRRLKTIQVSYQMLGRMCSRSGRLLEGEYNKITLEVRGADATIELQREFILWPRNFASTTQRQQQDANPVCLAFELPKTLYSHPVDEETYAFMPIGRFGFKFMIHANFVLTANRGQVVHAHESNQILRHKIPEEIVSAIEWLATCPKSPVLWHWPCYVQGLASVLDGFFRPLALCVLKKLRQTPLLWTDNNSFQKPNQSIRVCYRFRLDGRPILDGVDVRNRSIVIPYMFNQAAERALEELEVQQFTDAMFLDSFKSMVEEEPLIFRSRCQGWHSSIASILTETQRTSRKIFSRCENLNIIPLASGSWVTPKASNLFLPNIETQGAPPSLTIKLVEAAAFADPARRRLFEELGIKSCTRARICDTIISSQRQNRHIGVSDTVSELKFLFLSGFKPQPGTCFQFFNELGMHFNQYNTIHIPFGNIGSTVRRQLEQASAFLSWLHPDYNSVPDTGQVEVFVSWLQSWSQLRLWPEIFQREGLTPAMSSIYSSQGSRALLTHLHYRVNNGGTIPIYNDQSKQCLSNLNVTTDQGLKKLHETALPNVAMLSGALLPSLDIPEPADRTWSFLGHFGVFVDLDTRCLLQCLRNMKQTGSIELTNQNIVNVYHNFKDPTGTSKQIISQAFESEQLVYLGKNNWISPSNCRLDAKYPCTIFPLVSEFYPNNLSLFQDILDIRLANLDDLLGEFKASVIDTTLDDPHVEKFEKLLLAMNRMLRTRKASTTQIATMKELFMFPVSCPASNEDPNSAKALVRLQRAKDKFWIGDIQSLKSKFTNSLVLLAIHGSVIKKLSNVFSTLEMDRMRLSESVVSETTSDGLLGLKHEQWTRLLQRKMPFLISLLQHPEEMKDRHKHFIVQLNEFCVELVERIKIYRYVKDGISRVSVEENGEVCLVPDTEQLIVHVAPGVTEPEFLDSLVNCLSGHWNLKDDYRKLLHKVMVSSSPKRFTEDFERAGIEMPRDIGSVSVDGDLAHPGRRAYSNSIGSQSEMGPALSPIQEAQIDGIYASGDDEDIENHQRYLIPSQSKPLHINNIVSQTDCPAAIRWADATAGAYPTEDAVVQNRHNDRTEGRERSMTDSIFDRLRMQMDTLSLQGQDPETSLNCAHPSEIRVVGSSSLVSSQPHSEQFNPLQKDLRLTRNPQQSSLYSSGIPRISYEGQNPSNELASGRQVGTGTGLSNHAGANYHLIGKLGEALIYNFLVDILGSSFSYRHWTSRNRNEYFPENPFTDREGDYSDFTFEDHDGKLSRYFIGNIPGYEVPRHGSTAPKYHLEVKTTTSDISCPAMLSNNQIWLARQHSQHITQQTNDMYVLVRVTDLEGTPMVCFFPDPWHLICQGQLSVTTEGHFLVRPVVPQHPVHVKELS